MNMRQFVLWELRMSEERIYVILTDLYPCIGTLLRIGEVVDSTGGAGEDVKLLRRPT